MDAPQDFMSWLSDPARTNDELFTVELLLEMMRGREGWPAPRLSEDLEERMERMRERKHNPRYRPSLPHDQLLALQEKNNLVKHLACWSDADRPTRDLEALRFFPFLIDLNLSGADVSDLSPLAGLLKVQSLSIGEYNEFAGRNGLCFDECGEMPELETLSLALRNPWPDLRALANSPALKQLRFSGNILAFEQVEVLPAARVVSLCDWVDAKVPVRNLCHLPRMPEVKLLTIHRTASLEGAERYPTVVNLDLDGIFHDLTPLASLEKVTALTLVGEQFNDLAPIARMPRLRELRLVRERAIDLSPLADAPQLRRVEMERCGMMGTEVAALNAGLLPEAADFELEEPRPLPPLQFFVIGKENKEAQEYFQQRTTELTEQREAFFDGDEAFAKAETRAMIGKVQSGLDALLGRGWGILSGTLYFINLRRFADTVRVREIVQLLRELSARSRIPWKFNLIVEPHGDMSDDLEEMAKREERAKRPEGDWLASYFDPEAVLRENEEQRRQREERYAQMEREHLLQLRDEEGVDPALLYSSKSGPEPEPEEEEEEPDDSLSPNDNEDGTVAIAPPPPPPAGTENLSDDLMYYLDVYEECMVVAARWADRARYQLGQAPTEWYPGLSPAQPPTP